MKWIIHFEDLLFHLEEIATQIFEYVGGKLEPTFTFTQDSAKDTEIGHLGVSYLFTSIMIFENDSLTHVIN